MEHFCIQLVWMVNCNPTVVESVIIQLIIPFERVPVEHPYWRCQSTVVPELSDMCLLHTKKGIISWSFKSFWWVDPLAIQLLCMWLCVCLTYDIMFIAIIIIISMINLIYIYIIYNWIGFDHYDWAETSFSTKSRTKWLRLKIGYPKTWLTMIVPIVPIK